MGLGDAEKETTSTPPVPGMFVSSSAKIRCACSEPKPESRWHTLELASSPSTEIEKHTPKVSCKRRRKELPEVSKRRRLALSQGRINVTLLSSSISASLATVRRSAATASSFSVKALASGTLMTKSPVAMKMAARPLERPKPTPKAMPMAAPMETPVAMPIAAAWPVGGGGRPQVKQVQALSSPQSLQSQKLSSTKCSGIWHPSRHMKGVVVVVLVVVLVVLLLVLLLLDVLLVVALVDVLVELDEVLLVEVGDVVVVLVVVVVDVVEVSVTLVEDVVIVVLVVLERLELEVLDLLLLLLLLLELLELVVVLV